MYEIVEDCSPYYIKFRHPNQEALIQLAREKYFKLNLSNFQHPFPMRTLELDSGMELLNLLPFKDKFKFRENRVSYIIATPGARNHIHIDGACVSFNYGIDMQDNNCITRWYDFETVERTYKSRPNLPMDRYSVSPDQVQNNPIPSINSFTHKQGECILFNSNIYHDVDNKNSSNLRTILTFRAMPATEITFDVAKRILFS
jgi:hypothetical protein